MNQNRTSTNRFRAWAVSLAVLAALGASVVVSPAANARPPQVNPTVELAGVGPEQAFSYQILGAGFSKKGTVQIVLQTPSGSTVATVTVRASKDGTFTYNGTTGNAPDCEYNAFVTDLRTGAQATPYPLGVISWVCTS